MIIIIFTILCILAKLPWFEFADHRTSSISNSPPLISNIDVHENETSIVIKDKAEKIGIKWFIRDKSRKLLYCFIPKNACTMFKRLFYGLINDNFDAFGKDYSWIHGKIDREGEKYKPISDDEIKDILFSSSWRSVLIVRDPLERLVSGFEDKCIRSSQKQFWCEQRGRKNEKPTKNFTIFIERIINKINNNLTMNIHNHYRPQSTFCGSRKYLKYYDYIIVYHKSKIAEDTLKFMENTNIGINKWYNNWGEYHNETMFDQHTKHSTQNNNDHDSLKYKIEFYSKYYDKELSNRVLNAYKMDYDTFKLPIPKWVYYL